MGKVYFVSGVGLVVKEKVFIYIGRYFLGVGVKIGVFIWRKE